MHIQVIFIVGFILSGDRKQSVDKSRQTQTNFRVKMNVNTHHFPENVHCGPGYRWNTRQILVVGRCIIADLYEKKGIQIISLLFMRRLVKNPWSYGHTTHTHTQFLPLFIKYKWSNLGLGKPSMDIDYRYISRAVLSRIFLLSIRVYSVPALF